VLAKSGANIIAAGGTGTGASSRKNLGSNMPFSKAMVNTGGDDGALSGAGERP